MSGFRDFAVHAGLIAVPVVGLTAAPTETAATVALAGSALIEAYWGVVRPDD